MLSEEQRNKSLEKLDGYKKQISAIKVDLNLLNDQKEEAFKKKDNVSKDILQKIREIKKLAGDRNRFTARVKENKTKRTELRKLVSRSINEFKELDKQRKDLMQKHNLKVTPGQLERQIQQLEMKIETEAISFDKEKKVMKEIKVLKKQLNEAKSVSQVFDNSSKLSKDIDVNKKEMEEVHAKVQNFAKQGQEKHEQMIALSKEVDELKKKEAEYREKFMKLKDKFTEVNDKLKKLLPKLNEVKQKLDQDRRTNKKDKEMKIEAVLKEKESIVEEKIKKGKKLTTEDLLVFQRKS